jgi:predicted dehydrogenase
MTNPIRWGILSTGGIAHKMAKTLQAMPDAELVAVGSRNAESAEAFGAQYDIPHRHADYESLAANPDVDVIYVATPHTFHHENTLLCLEHGKHVLCEKAFSINATQAQAMVNKAREKNLFLMEAMWTRFLPAIVQVRDWLQSGAIGTPHMLTANFCVRLNPDPQGRLYNPNIGGGALLDLGIYPVSFAVMAFGLPDDVHSVVHMSVTGVDEYEAIQFKYADGRIASLTAGMSFHAPRTAMIAGSTGHIVVHPNFHSAEQVTLALNGAEPQTLDLPHSHNGFEYQVAEVMACLRAGKTESDIMPLDESVGIMRLNDALRHSWGLRYPEEREND